MATALALQIGSEVSYNELAQTVGLEKTTAARYVDILEKAFIIFRLPPFSRNLRNELKRRRKIYFYDTGVRNAIINNLNPLALRQDTGALWENFLVSERIKRNQNAGVDKSVYFWRTREGREIDYLEEAGGTLDGFEIKWKDERYRAPKSFMTAYPGSEVKLVSRTNYREFLA